MALKVDIELRNNEAIRIAKADPIARPRRLHTEDKNADIPPAASDRA
jgi:hypothetical protein